MFYVVSSCDLRSLTRFCYVFLHVLVYAFSWFLLIFGDNSVLCKNWVVSYACADCVFSVDVSSLTLTLAILSVKGGAAAGLLDQKKGKFAWFSHSAETHGNVAYALCV